MKVRDESRREGAKIYGKRPRLPTDLAKPLREKKHNDDREPRAKRSGGRIALSVRGLPFPSRSLPVRRLSSFSQLAASILR